jgi:hypothetical protein
VRRLRLLTTTQVVTLSYGIVVSQGAITVSSALTEDLNCAFTAAQTTGTVYAGMDLNYATPASFSGTASSTYFTNLITKPPKFDKNLPLQL